MAGPRPPALRRIPTDLVASLIPAAITVAVDRAGDAIPHLERAHAVRPDAPEPRLGLARAYTMLDRPADAAEHHRALEHKEAAPAARPGP